MPSEPPLDAAGVARRQFASVRRGYDADEVRAFLLQVSRLVARLERDLAELGQRVERAESRAVLAENLDRHRLVELLGEETARVLDVARDAAADIRSKAEEAAARLVHQGHDDARELLERAESEAQARQAEILAEAEAVRRDAEHALDRGRADGEVAASEIRRVAEAERDRLLAEGEEARKQGEADAAEIRAAAREEGRHLVAEAQAARERILGDLGRRRRAAREQLERLNGARERLLAAYAVVRRTVQEATAELTVALPEARVASEQAMRRVQEEPEPTVEELEAELSVARMAGLLEEAPPPFVPDDPTLPAVEDLIAPAEPAAGSDDDAVLAADAGPEVGRVATVAEPPDAAQAPPAVGEDAGGDDVAGPVTAPGPPDEAAADASPAPPGESAPATGVPVPPRDAPPQSRTPPFELAAYLDATTGRLGAPEGGPAGPPPQVHGAGERWGLWPFRRRGGRPVGEPAGPQAMPVQPAVPRPPTVGGDRLRQGVTDQEVVGDDAGPEGDAHVVPVLDAGELAMPAVADVGEPVPPAGTGGDEPATRSPAVGGEPAVPAVADVGEPVPPAGTGGDSDVVPGLDAGEPAVPAVADVGEPVPPAGAGGDEPAAAPATGAEASLSPVADAGEFAIPAPVADAGESAAAPTPVADAGESAIPAPVADAGESAPTPVADAGESATAAAPVADAGGSAAAPTPVADAGESATAAAPVADAGESAPTPVAEGGESAPAPGGDELGGGAAPAAGTDESAAAVAPASRRPPLDELFARIRAERENPPAATPAPAGAAGATDTGVASGSSASPGGSRSRRSAPPTDAGARRLAPAGLRSPAAASREDAVDREADARLLQQRDAVLEPIEQALARRLKRVLANDQNDVFDRLRRSPKGTIDELVPPWDAHVDLYAAAARDDLAAAWEAGAAVVRGRARASADQPSAESAARLGAALVAPMRDRIGRSLDESAGDIDEATARLRALYREWKGQRIGDVVRHYTAAAYAAGSFAAAPGGSELRWLVDRTADPCPDADDNALAHGVTKGQAFPTGDRCAPAHQGCRCLVLPVGVEPPRSGVPAS